MKAFFREIRAGDVDAVAARLQAKPELISATATAPPKKDEGQSPLQVAIKSGASHRFAVAHLLLDHGADVLFQEAPVGPHPWTAPVLHDAIRAAVFSARGAPDATAELSDAACGLLERLLTLGADPQARDNKGNDALFRFMLDARQIWNDERDAQGLGTDLRRIAAALLAHGADPDAVHSSHKRAIGQMFANEPILELLTPAPVAGSAMTDPSKPTRRWTLRRR